MNNSDIWHWCWRIARIFVACLLAAAVLGIIDRSLSSPRHTGAILFKQAVNHNKKLLSDIFPFSSFDRRNDLESAEETGSEDTGGENDSVQKTPTEKNITLIAGKDGLQTVFELKFSKKSPLYRELIKKLARPDNASSVDMRQAEIDYLGYIVANRRNYPVELNNLEVSDQTNIAYFKFASARIPLESLFEDKERRLLNTRIYFGHEREIWEKTSVTVKTEPEITVIPNHVAPTSQSAEATRFDNLAAKSDELIFDISYPAVSGGEKSQPISGVVQAINDGLPILRSLLPGFLYSLPFLLFFVLKRKNPNIIAASTPLRFSDIAALLLILYIGLAVLNFTIDVTWLVPLWLGGEDFISQYFGQPATGAALLMTVFPTIIWSNIVSRWEKAAEKASSPEETVKIIAKPRKLVIIALSATASVFCLLSVLVVIYSRSASKLVSIITDYHTGRVLTMEIDPLVYFLPVAAYFSILWALYELEGRFVWFKTLLILFLLIFIAAIQSVLYEFGVLKIIFAALLSLPFMYACFRLGYHLATAKFFKSERKNLSFFQRGVLTICIIGFLFFLLRTSNEYLAIYGIIANLAYSVGRLGIFALLFVLLRVLRCHSELSDSWIIPKGIIDAGGVLALSFLFLPSRQWLFVLIVFLTAYMLLKNWAVLSLRNQKIPKIRRGDTMRSLIREKIAVNDAERGLRALKKELLAKIGKGDIPFKKFETDTGALEETIREKKENLSEKRLTYRELMMFGAVESAWERGKSGAFYGLLFSLPWIILILFNLKKTTLPNINFEILSILTTAALAVIQYPLQGFLFGYFYPHLRGADGMRKGFNFFLLLFIPTFIATVFARPTDGEVWTNHLLWSLQLFIQSMLLGLVAGDYETLRRSGLNCRYLIEVHNLSSLTVWGSSVLVAISAAVTTLVTSGVSGLITVGVKTLLPELPELPKN